MSRSNKPSKAERGHEDFRKAAENLERIMRRIEPFVRRPKVSDPRVHGPWRSSDQKGLRVDRGN